MKEMAASKVGKVLNVADTMIPQLPAPPPRIAQKTIKRILLKGTIQYKKLKRTIRVFNAIRCNKAAIGSDHREF